MKTVTLVPEEKNERFSTILNIELNHLQQATNMLSTFNVLQQTSNGINFDEALDVVKRGNKMAVIGTQNVEQSSKSSKVWVAIDQLQNLIGMVQGAATQNWAAFGMAARAFLDLNSQRNGGHFTVFKQSSKSISYQYNMFNVTQNKSTGPTMVGQLTSLDIELTASKADLLSLVAGSDITQSMNFKSITFVQELQS